MIKVLQRLNPFRYAISLIKARRSPKLVPKKVMVTRDGKTYQTTVWVLPEEANKEEPRTVQYDLFEEGSVAGRSLDEIKKDLVNRLNISTHVVYQDAKGNQKTGQIVSKTASVLVIRYGNDPKQIDYVSHDKVVEVLPEKEPGKIDNLIKQATPENRSAVAAQIAGAKIANLDINPLDYQYEPGVVEIDGEKYRDYTQVDVTKISLISEKDILNKPKPSWMPPFEDAQFRWLRFRIPAVKLDDNRYYVHGYIQKYSVGAVVSGEVLAAMQDYYLKRAKALYPNRRIRVLSKDRATYTELGLVEKLRKVKGNDRFRIVRETLEDIQRKISDMNIQIEEYESSFLKGRETAYGDKNARDYLFESHGVKVKRQNGDEITRQEVEDIRKALDKVYAVFGNRSSMSKKFGLKISHSGKVLMHARNALGVYMPLYRAIGVTFSRGEEEFGFTLAHEFAHFMDNYLGMKNKRWFLSDDWGSDAGKIADMFRRNMIKPQKSDYQNRTCECFARAMEQYFVTKTGDINNFLKGHKGNYVNPEVFNNKIIPMIEKFLKDNDELLKSMQHELRLVVRV